MKAFALACALICLLISNLSHSATKITLDNVVQAMVPKGKIVEKDGREYRVKTPAGTKIDLEFYRDGSLEEASGKNLNKGDHFEPGQGLISLSSAAQSAAKSGHHIEGKWSLEKDEKRGWIYEFYSNHHGIEIDYLVDARNGRIEIAE